MNGYECNGTDIFMRWEMECSIQRGKAELNGTFHLSPNENSCIIAPIISPFWSVQLIWKILWVDIYKCYENAYICSLIPS